MEKKYTIPSSRTGRMADISQDSMFTLGFQGFLILICVAIYAVLLQNVAISGDAINSIWSIVGYTVLLCFSLFKTSSVAKSILGAH